MSRHIRYLIVGCIGLVSLYGISRLIHSDYLFDQKIALFQDKIDKMPMMVDIMHRQYKSDVEIGRALANKGIYYYHFTNDTLDYWNENHIRIKSIRTGKGNQYFFNDGSQLFAVYVLFTKNSYSIAGLALRDLMEVSNAGDRARTTTLFSANKQSSVFVQLKTNASVGWEWIILILYFVSIFLSVFGIRIWSVQLANNKRLITALCLFSLGVFFIRMVSLWIMQAIPLIHLSFFDGSIRPSPLSPTLGDLLINICLLSSLVWFIRAHVKPAYFHLKNRYDLAVAFLNYIFVYLTAILMVISFRQLIVHSGLVFDLEYIFYLDIRSIVALVGILLLAISLFLLDLHLLRIIRHLKLDAKKRLWCNLVALLCTTPLYFTFSIQLPVTMFLALVTYLTLLDLFIDYYKPHAAWYLAWTMTGAIMISTFLFQFHIEKEWNQRLSLAESLRDEVLSSGHVHDQMSPLFLKNQLTKKEASASYLALYDIQYIENKNSSTMDQNELYTPLDEHSGFVISKKSNQLFKAISFFSYTFILFNLLLIVLAILHRKFTWGAFTVFRFFPSRRTLRFRIQLAMMSISIFSFALIAIVIVIYIQRNNSQWISGNHVRLEHSNMEDGLATLDDGYRMYDIHGFNFPDGEARLNYSDWQEIRKGHVDESKFVLVHQSNQPYILEKKELQYNASYKRKLNDFLGTLLNLYVFLLILIIIGSMVVANSIASPLTLLSSKLKQIQIGGKNQRLEWNRNDELGALIRNYNEMITELDRSTRMLALTERETAWREMAKQVAHEIKNPLTPMKLITQHLQNSIARTEAQEVPALVKRVTSTLIEQIETLSKIASEFSNFAKLPAPENDKLILNEIVTSTHDLFRKREDMDIHLRVPIDEIYVFADKNHMIRVLTNIIKNAIQSIPLGRRGKIEIMLYKQAEMAVIKVSDNGCGIPDSMRDKVFYPNFTTKNSGTGLGLAIVRDIIDSCNGRIYFQTVENKGTDFFIELPLMHMADNFFEAKRVSL